MMKDHGGMGDKSQRSLFTIIFLLLVVIVLVGMLLAKGNGYQRLNINSPAATAVPTTVTVGNVVPSVSSVIINGGNTITPIQGTATSVPVTYTVIDNNSCMDLTTVNVALYKVGTTCSSSGNANNDSCYFWTDTAASSSCATSTNISYSVSHNFNIEYYADYGTWNSTVTPSDASGPGIAATSSAVALAQVMYFDVSPSLVYGSVSNGATSSGNHIATTTNLGNVAIDFGVQGVNLVCSTFGSIPVGNQQYSTSTFSYGNGTNLSASSTSLGKLLSAPAYNTIPVVNPTYWQISIPNGVKGTCSGNTTFTATAV